ncbi:MAG: hypothetical protein LBK47_01200 [Prevotellaceae bacterium]|nr:hypothetical protein [Prevotellaceae bacterium]
MKKLQLEALSLEVPELSPEMCKRLMGGNYGEINGGEIEEVYCYGERSMDMDPEDRRDDREFDNDDNNNDTPEQPLELREYTGLNQAEQDFILQHPIAAAAFAVNANQAKSEAAIRFPESLHNGSGDAFRHAFWSALNAYDQGRGLAEQFGNAHESGPGNPEAEKNMDLHNNSVGYDIGEEAQENGWSEQQIIDAVLDALDNGRLIVLNK